MVTQPHDFLRARIDGITPSMRYAGQEPFAQWQAKARAKLNELLGLPLEAPAQDGYAVEYEREEEAFTETRFTFESEPGYRVPCHFLTPRGARGPLPVVICLQGHSKGMHISLGRPKFEGDAQTISGGDRDFALRAVREGYCALVIEQRGFGESGGTEKGPACHNPATAALLIGRTIVGERVWDVQRAIDLMEKRFAQADTQKIICLGNSGGGTTTFFAACVETRIRYAMVSSYFCTFDDSIAAMQHCVCNVVPGIRAYFDMGDLAGLIAPRALVVVSGREDPIFPQHGVQKAYALAQKQYEAAGVPERLSLVVGEGGHRFYADDAWPVMNAYLREG